ncbi:MAG: universal stress protein [Deferrisomatales bacterium]
MIPEYKTILYATDLSPNAAQAFRHAIGLARCYDGAVHILHVLPEEEQAVVNWVATVMGEDRLAELELEHKEELAAEIRKRLEAFAAQELGDRPEDTARVAAVEIRYGDPAEEIVAAADRIDADLIVLGSHGKGRLRTVLLGSVTERVLRRSRRPVLISRLMGR